MIYIYIYIFIYSVRDDGGDDDDDDDDDDGGWSDLCKYLASLQHNLGRG